MAVLGPFLRRLGRRRNRINDRGSRGAPCPGCNSRFSAGHSGMRFTAFGGNLSRDPASIGIPPMTTITEQLVVSTTEGTWGKHVPALRRYFAKRVPAGDIDDLVQEVLLRMQAHHSRPIIEHLDRYLFTVAASVLSDQRRRQLVRHRSDHETLTELEHPVEELSPERVLLDQEALCTAVAAIANLPPRTRDVFVLHRFEEMTCSAIASHLGITISGVEKHIMKALSFLRARLQED
jgi:RNA polymerase sigma factor (sigma-70 family)